MGVGSSNSKGSGPKLTKEALLRERNDEQHKEYVANVLKRPDASSEMKGILIECAEAKRELKNTHAENDFLKATLADAKAEIEKYTKKIEQAQDLNRDIAFTHGISLLIIFIIMFALYTSSQWGRSNNGENLGGLQYNPVNPVNRMEANSEDITTLLIISEQNFIDMVDRARESSQWHTMPSGELFFYLQKQKQAISYYQVLSFIQNTFLPRITFTLIAACMGIVLVFTAVVGSIVPHWTGMSTSLRFQSMLSSTALFFLLGLYLSSIQDDVDIPAGVVLTIGVLSCPIVVCTGMDHLRAGRHSAAHEQDDWTVILSALSVLTFSTVLLHTVAFAPLSIIAVASASLLVWVLVGMFLDLLFPTRRVVRGTAGGGSRGSSGGSGGGSGAASGEVGVVIISRVSATAALWVLSLIAWNMSDGIVFLLQPARANATYSLVTNVSLWLDWGLMMTVCGWFYVLYFQIFYWIAAELGWRHFQERKTFAPFLAGLFVNFLHFMAVFMITVQSSYGDRAIVLGVFTHICGAVFSVESFVLTTASLRRPGLGPGELVVLLNAVLLSCAKVYGYSVLMVFSVLNIAMYILLKYGVFTAAAVAAVVIGALTFIA